MGELQQQKLSNQIKSDNMMHKQFTYAVVCVRYTDLFLVHIFLYASISFIEHIVPIVPIVPTDTILVK